MTYTVESLAEEQKGLLLDRFNYDFAWRLGALIRERAVSAPLPLAITVAHGTDLVFSVLMPGATPDNFDWAARKRATVNRFHRSSLSMRLAAEARGYNFNERFCLPASEFSAYGGGVPLIEKDGTLVGAAAVSGLADVDDHRVIVEALRLLLAQR